jgi:NodT family efflux transporter outer membrane factor (OMF) lipoprotein
MRKLFNVVFLLFLALAIGSQEKSFGFWAKKAALKPINVQEKADYVNLCWWNNFSDPYLKEYVFQAIKYNHDLRQASWKVEEYRQNVKYAFSKELPSLSVGGNYIGAHFPETIKGVKNNIFAVPFQANYEADIFLKNHDKTKSSKKSYEASKFEEKSIYISLATDVSTVYLNIIKFDKQISLQCQLVAIENEKLRRETNRFNRGVVSAAQLNNSKKDYEIAKSDLEELIKLRDKSLTQLAVLIGDSPENICNLKRQSFDKFDYTAIVPCEISSDVVFSRPDILAAEAKLQKANIDVRVARKDFLPTISITGLYALSNVGAASFGSWESTIAAIAAGATLDLFKGGMKFANLKIYKSRYEQMFESYKQTDLTAIKEVNDSLIMIKQDTVIDNNTIENLNIQKDSYNRSSNKFKSGVISYPQLLTDKEVVINMEQNQVNTKTNRLIDYLTLYKAVGGKL